MLNSCFIPRAVRSGLLTVLCLVGMSSTRGQTLTTLASFNGDNGYIPSGSLTVIGKTMYGVCVAGGGGDVGTVFSVPVSGGAPTLLSSFKASEGAYPNSGLVIGNTLYGVCSLGGGSDVGTVFSVPVSGGTPTVLAAFNGIGGNGPSGSLTVVGNTLYGTAEYSGTGDSGNGMIFSVPVSGGSLTTLAAFNGSDGANPTGGLVLGGNTLYGMCEGGGVHGEGVVFSVPVSGGTPTVLASFNGADGISPRALDPVTSSLTLVGSTLYGTTEYGGTAFNSGQNGDGVVFSVPVTGGTPTVLASFNGTDGAHPSSGLTVIGNRLYGVTSTGSVYASGAYGNGTVFSLPISGGTPTVLASFNDIDGEGPGGGNFRYPNTGSLTLVGNTLYGTCSGGGVSGDGTVFALTLNSAWASATSGYWSDSINWTGGVPNCAGIGATFNIATTATVTVTQDEPLTLGSLQFGNSGNASVGYTLRGSGSNALTLNNAGSAATITVTNGTHAINAPVVLADNLVVTGYPLAGGGTDSWALTFGTASSITDNGAGYSLTMSGSGGKLVLSGSDSYTGGTFVTAGTLEVTAASALPGGTSLTVGSSTSIFEPLEGAEAAGSAEVSTVPEPSDLRATGHSSNGRPRIRTALEAELSGLSQAQTAVPQIRRMHA